MLKLFFAVSSFFTLLLSSCTTMDLSGGTETGNPSLAVAAAFELGDTADAWLPSHYLVNENQLDPGFISAKPELKLSKSLADTAPITTDSLRIDTIIVIDSIFIKDTVHHSHIITDTINDTTEWGLNTKISQNDFFDTIFINDTVLRKDTFFVNKTSPSSQVVYDSVIQNSDGYLPRNTITKVDSSVIWTVRQTNYSGITVNEEYSDGDGDSVLYKAQASSPKSWLHATYSTSGSITTLAVLFDAGEDKQFFSTNDNRIYTLQRTLTRSNETYLNVSYRNNYSSFSDDSSILVVTKRYSGDSLISSTTRYNCIPGNVPENHLLNKLCSIDKNLTFSSNNLNNIELHLKPDTPLSAGQYFSSALLNAKIYFGRGRIGELSGKIDFATNSFTGSYFSNGIEYNASYDRKTGQMELTEHP
jgi:hypothetical protein